VVIELRSRNLTQPPERWGAFDILSVAGLKHRTVTGHVSRVARTASPFLKFRNIPAHWQRTHDACAE
jgi:hypothetical protein